MHYIGSGGQPVLLADECSATNASNYDDGINRFNSSIVSRLGVDLL